jgi:hypothetical protein
MTSRSGDTEHMPGTGTPARPASWPAMAAALATDEVCLGRRC